MRDAVRFLLNGEAVALRGVDPRTTLLDWLREARGLTGTKEGCNEGDCGACTVGVTRLEAGGARRRAVNACIQLLPMLDGAAVTTVEGIGGPPEAPGLPRPAQQTPGGLHPAQQTPGGLHPAQDAMARLHGSQCGFCTPGIVMSLWCAHPDGPEGRAALADRLAGNLCRCTGYGPILAAGAAMHDAPARDADLGPALAALGPAESLRLEGGGAVAHVPATLAEAAALAAAHPDATLVAGATDVGLWLTKRLERPETLIFLSRIAGFDAVTETERHVEIAAGATWTAAAGPLARLAPDLGEVIRRFASVQVRNSATVGGNIANGSPIGDGAPPLIALGAEVVLRHGEAERTVPLEDFFLAYGRQDRRPGELVAALRVPRPADPAALRCAKISKRFDQDITATLGALLIEVEGGRVARARIAFGGMAGVPKRARAVEAALIGRPWTLATAQAAAPAFARDFAPLSDMRASAEYRLRVSANLLVRAFHEMSQAPPATRLAGGPPDRGAAA